MVAHTPPVESMLGGTEPGRDGHRGAGTADSRASVRLLRPLDTQTWLADAGEGLIAARPAPMSVDGSGPADPPSLPPTANTDHLVPFLGVSTVDGTPWLVSTYVPGVMLDRLLVVATLTPFQAASIAGEIYAGLAALHGAGGAHGRLSARTVRVGADGVVRLTDWVGAAIPQPHERSLGSDPGVDAAVARSGDLDAARAIVAELARNADRPVVRHGGPEDRVLAGLVRFGANDRPTAALSIEAELRTMVRNACGVGFTHVDAHAELARLVEVASRHLRADGHVPDARQSLARVGKRTSALPDRRLSAADWRSPKRHRVAWAAVAVVVLVAGAVVVARGPGRSLADRVLHRHRAAATSTTNGSGGHARTATAAGAGSPRPVPVLAPASAGVVSRVSLRPLTSCAPGGRCEVRLTVGVKQAPTVRRVQWTVTVIDRCTGARTAAATGVLVAAPQTTSAFTTRTVRLPKGKDLAAVAVTTTPAKAASAPVLIPATARRC